MAYTNSNPVGSKSFSFSHVLLLFSSKWVWRTSARSARVPLHNTGEFLRTRTVSYKYVTQRGSQVTSHQRIGPNNYFNKRNSQHFVVPYLSLTWLLRVLFYENIQTYYTRITYPLGASLWIEDWPQAEYKFTLKLHLTCTSILRKLLVEQHEKKEPKPPNPVGMLQWLNTHVLWKLIWTKPWQSAICIFFPGQVRSPNVPNYSKGNNHNTEPEYRIFC